MTRLIARLRALFHRRRLDAELADELSAHLDFAAEEHLARGMSSEEARRYAALKFGGALQTAEACRDQRGFPLLDSLAQDARYALRGMRRSPGFTLVAVMTLAIGIGVNAAVFTVTNAVLFQGYRFVRNDRVLYLRSQDTKHPQEYGYPVSYPDFLDWQAQTTAFAGLGAYSGGFISLNDTGGLAERAWAAQVSANAFGVLEQQPILGRDFAPSDEQPGAAPVAILSHALWEHRYDRDPSVVGRTIRIDGFPTTVVGVMREGFVFPQDLALWQPLMATADRRKRDVRNIAVFGRLRDDATAANARAELDTICRRLAATYPADRSVVPLVWNFRQSHTGGPEAMIWASMWGAVGFVLLIACANLAGLLLARATSRSREIAVRVALGAGRWRIVRQCLTESVMLSAAGGLLGWWIAIWGARAYELAVFHGVSWYDFSIGHRFFGYLVAISVGTGLLFGIVPALRVSTFDINHALKDSGRSAAGGRHRSGLSALLVISEMALAIVLLTGAGIMIHSFLKVYRADLGVRTTDVLTMSVELPQSRYPTDTSRVAFVDRLTMGLAAIPGVESVAVANTIPTNPSLKVPYEVDGVPSVDARNRPTLSGMVVGPAYFETLGAAVLSGRAFSDRDGATSAAVAIVNQRFASRHWPRESAIGKHVRIFDGKTPQPWLTVIGVVSNIVQDDFTRQAFGPLVYLPYRQAPRAGMRVLARARVAPASLAIAFRREVQALDPGLPGSVSTLDDVLARAYGTTGLDVNVVVFLMFAAIALLLASLGLYAVVAHAVSQRTQEIGIRIAMGATARDVISLVLKQGLPPVGVGLGVGLLASFGVMPILRSVLVQVSPADPIAFVVAPVVLVMAAMLGCLIPARRATRVDPVVALRHD
jgi:predicted permease